MSFVKQCLTVDFSKCSNEEMYFVNVILTETLAKMLFKGP